MSQMNTNKHNTGIPKHTFPTVQDRIPNSGTQHEYALPIDVLGIMIFYFRHDIFWTLIADPGERIITRIHQPIPKGIKRKQDYSNRSNLTNLINP